MFLGASSWVFDWAPPYDKAIQSIAKLGFKGVELTIWNNEFLRDYYTPAAVSELRKRIAGNGLELTNVFCLPSGGASADAAIRKNAVVEFRRAAEVAKSLGSSLLTTCTSCPFELDFPFEQTRPTSQTWTVSVPKGLDFKKNYEDYISTLNGFGEVCEEFDVRLALEPHPHRIMMNADSMLRILEKVNTSRIGMNLDPSHLFPMGEIAHIVVYQVNRAIFHCHFSDNDGQSNAHWRPGKGKIDWNATVRALHEIGFDGAISLELEDVPGAAGYPGFHRNPCGSYEILEHEYKLAKEYMERVFEEEQIPLSR